MLPIGATLSPLSTALDANLYKTTQDKTRQYGRTEEKGAEEKENELDSPHSLNRTTSSIGEEKEVERGSAFAYRWVTCLSMSMSQR